MSARLACILVALSLDGALLALFLTWGRAGEAAFWRKQLTEPYSIDGSSFDVLVLGLVRGLFIMAVHVVAAWWPRRQKSDVNSPPDLMAAATNDDAGAGQPSRSADDALDEQLYWRRFRAAGISTMMALLCGALLIAKLASVATSERSPEQALSDVHLVLTAFATVVSVLDVVLMGLSSKYAAPNDRWRGMDGSYGDQGERGGDGSNQGGADRFSSQERAPLLRFKEALFGPQRRIAGLLAGNSSHRAPPVLPLFYNDDEFWGSSSVAPEAMFAPSLAEYRRASRRDGPIISKSQQSDSMTIKPLSSPSQQTLSTATIMSSSAPSSSSSSTTVFAPSYNSAATTTTSLSSSVGNKSGLANQHHQTAFVRPSMTQLARLLRSEPIASSPSSSFSHDQLVQWLSMHTPVQRRADAEQVIMMMLGQELIVQVPSSSSFDSSSSSSSSKLFYRLPSFSSKSKNTTTTNNNNNNDNNNNNKNNNVNNTRTVSPAELPELARQMASEVEVKTREIAFSATASKIYEDVALGSEIIDFLMRRIPTESRLRAVRVAQRMMDDGLLFAAAGSRDFVDGSKFYSFFEKTRILKNRKPPRSSPSNINNDNNNKNNKNNNNNGYNNTNSYGAVDIPSTPIFGNTTNKNNKYNNNNSYNNNNNANLSLLSPQSQTAHRLMSAMLRPGSGLRLVRKDGRDVFRLHYAVDWLVNHFALSNRDEAMEVLQNFIERGILQRLRSNEPFYYFEDFDELLRRGSV